MVFIMVSLAISLIIVVFALQNSGMVPIVFFSWTSEIPLVVVIFISVFAGAAIIFFLALWKDLKRKFTTVSYKASEYKGIVNSKKEAFSERFEKRKPSTENNKTIEALNQTEPQNDHASDDCINEGQEKKDD
ncbi:MAG: hypothetical protein APF84_06265 [Gracilibacter sp. BRH_c7a]|nr:MAG: hypothetical protein APF84_06265 [Gracilibacter sp. BRH_c7a]